MKKILFLLLTIPVLSSGRLWAQSDSDIYLIGTTVPLDSTHTGFNKEVGEAHPSLITPFIGFFINSPNFERIPILHFNSVSDPKAVVDFPLSELSRFNLIEVDDLIASFLSEESGAYTKAKEWVDANYKRKVWIIDRNDFYKSLPSLPENDRMKLIEAVIITENTPGVEIHYTE